ncbi:hypothetical protein ABW20_dc0110710 [Dactylellina cionopaga]|nr:hypothetical protein ABW20_dc0110710 [Dactylellina cionopaga]
MTKKTYLRPPNDDYAPDNNIQLGHIWRDPKDPGSFINTPLPISDDIKVNHTHKGTWAIDIGHESHTKISFWARIAQIVGSGDNLYMITGVKIARGGDGSLSESKNFGIGNGAELDATAVGVPVGVGGQISYSKGAHGNQGFGSTGDFVFAYRVREIFYRKGVLKTKEFNKGAVLGEGMVPISKSERSELKIVIEDAEVGDDDVGGHGDIYPFIDDDDEECEIVI